MGNRVLIETIVPRTELDEVEKRGALFIPPSLKKDYTPMSTTGIVIAVGEGVEKGELEEGAMVLFPRVAGMDFSIGQVDSYRILHVSDILAVLVPTDGDVVEVKASDIEEGTGEQT